MEPKCGTLILGLVFLSYAIIAIVIRRQRASLQWLVIIFFLLLGVVLLATALFRP